MRCHEDVKFELSGDEAVFLQVWLALARGSFVGCMAEHAGGLIGKGYCNKVTHPSSLTALSPNPPPVLLKAQLESARLDIPIDKAIASTRLLADVES